jgi:hypothetical protein
MKQTRQEAGSVNPLLIASILLALLSAGLGGLSVWSFANYRDQKDNTDAKIAAAVTEAKKEQATQLEKDFIQREKQPYTTFTGPSDLGGVTFDYPKTWSVYVANNGSSGDYEAYLNPGVVPKVEGDQPYATRVIISSRSYQDTLKSYESLVKKGSLKSAPITINGFTGVRLDGQFSKTLEGSAVIFKVRDKTLLIATDATSFRTDFDTIIVKSLDFNP